MNRHTVLFLLLMPATLIAADNKAALEPTAAPDAVQHARLLFVHEGDIGHIYCHQKQECAIVAPDGEKHYEGI